MQMQCQSCKCWLHSTIVEVSRDLILSKSFVHGRSVQCANSSFACISGAYIYVCGPETASRWAGNDAARIARGAAVTISDSQQQFSHSWYKSRLQQMLRLMFASQRSSNTFINAASLITGECRTQLMSFLFGLTSMILLISWSSVSSL